MQDDLTTYRKKKVSWSEYNRFNSERCRGLGCGRGRGSMFGGSMNLMCHHPTISMFLTEVNYIIVRKNKIYVGKILSLLQMPTLQHGV